MTKGNLIIYSYLTLSFTMSAQYLGNLAKSAGGAKRAAEILEHVAECGDAHLKTRHEQNTWFEKLNLDIIFFYVVLALIPFALSKCCRKKKTKID